MPQRRTASTDHSADTPPARKHQALIAENLELRARLAEAEDALRAIREGEVDAVIVSGSKGDRVFSLSETENLHRLMVETMDEAGLAISAQGLLLYVNERAAALLQRGRSGLLGHSIQEFVTPADVPRLRRLLEACDAGTADDRIVFRAAGGAEVPMHLWANRLPRPGETVICLVGTDLTRIEADQALLAELRAHQQALKASKAEALKRMSQALIAREQAAQLAQSLREGDERKDRFLAILAHELRNPLAPIRNALDILKQQDAGSQDAIAVREMMERQLEHLVRLVDDLMEVSRITHGRIELRKEHVALKRVIESAVETVRPVLQTTGQKLLVDLPPGGLWLEGDPTRLVQIFANLLHNAVKFTGAGQSICIQAQVEPEGVVVVSVEDAGAGIAAALLPHVFEMFTRGERFPSQSRDGLGIGLTLVQQLVQLHGGRIEAYSAGPGQGSAFRVHLPLVAGDTTASGDPAAKSPGNADAIAGRRILVVDDNRDAAASLSTLLALNGADVRAVNDGASALAALETDLAAVVILDIGMPDLDGHEVARRIRARRDWDGIRLIAMSGLGQAAVRQRSIAVGFDQHLIKPVPFDVLLDVLASPSGGGSLRSPVPDGSGLSGCDIAVVRALVADEAECDTPAAVASSLVHDLAQPLTSAGCFALAARTLAAKSGGGGAAVSDALEGLEHQVQLAHGILELLRGVLSQSEPGAGGWNDG